MPNVLVVEDEGLVARTLQAYVEMNAGYRVAAVADDLVSALAAVETNQIDVALVDIHLARHASGYAVASELSARGVSCIFVTGHMPPFPMPEIACGCIAKPFTVTSVADALWSAPAGAARSFGSSRWQRPAAGFGLDALGSANS